MSVRLHFIVEGQTEETFLNRILVPHLANFDVFADGHSLTTGRKAGNVYRGGMLNYSQARKDMEIWMKQDNHSDSFFTTMFDLYALPEDFPEFEAARKCPDPYERVGVLEAAFSGIFGCHKFIPYIQLHEFEAVLLAEPEKFNLEFPSHDRAVHNLSRMVQEIGNPELIDDGVETAPSKRIINEIPEYEGAKASAGPIIAGKIGLLRIREKCQHFNQWLAQLENLGR